MNDREIISYLLLRTRMEARVIKRRWKDGPIPKIPAGELHSLEQSIAWLEKRAKENLEKEYGYSEDNP